MDATAKAKTSRWDKGVIAQIGALSSAIIASACCWLPLLLIGFGLSGGALVAQLEAWRPVLLPITFLFLGAAFYLTYRRGRSVHDGGESQEARTESCCADNTKEGTSCPSKGSSSGFLQRFNVAALWVVTVLVLGFAFFPNYVGVLLGKGNELADRPDVKKVVLNVEGMTCQACAASIDNAIEDIPDVVAAEVSYDKKNAVVGIAEGKEVPRDAILSAIAGAGDYQGHFANRAQYSVMIDGMTCSGCAVSVENALSQVPGVQVRSISVNPGKAVVTAEPSVSEEMLRQAVASAGFEPTAIKKTDRLSGDDKTSIRKKGPQ